jgi:hypothetical protein
LLVIRPSSPDLETAREKKETQPDKNKQKKPSTKSAKTGSLSTSGDNVTFFSDRLRDTKPKQATPAKNATNNNNANHVYHECSCDGDDSFELSPEESFPPVTHAAAGQTRHSQRLDQRPKVNYVVMNIPVEQLPQPVKKQARMKKDNTAFRKNEKGHSLSDTPPEPSNPNKKKRSAEVCAN